MRTAMMSFSMAAGLLLASPSAIHSQAPQLHPVEGVAFSSDGPVLRAHSEALKPFTVAGERGVIVGQQDGTFEAWLLPLKVLSHLTIEANIEGYTVPIDVNAQSAEIEVRPDRTIITYAHLGFTVRQIMFSPQDGPAGTGPVVLFEFDCVHPTDFTLRFTPELRWMWPERNEGVPGVEWVTGPALTAGDSRAENDKTGLAASGYYVLHADYPDLAAAVAIPGARAGILAPYQERPQVHAVEFRLHIDPARDRGRLYPLLMAYGAEPKAASAQALGATLQALNDAIPQQYREHAEAYRKLLANSVSIETPDKELDAAFQWAVVSIEQLKAKPWAPAQAPGQVAAKDERALVAGYYASGDSARPGFGWFFGRDALYTLYAVNGYGDFALSRSELEFLIHRQRTDGKIMHEYSQTAAAIDWQQFPYMYAAADSTPLFLMAMLDYVRASGDVDFLKANRDAVEKAWAFETGHADANGIYSNEQGTGWVESWPGGMPHQEIYLALLDQQASAAMGEMERLMGLESKAVEATRRGDDIARAINQQFSNGDKDCYAFSRNKDGSLDRTRTVYPALAWWSGAAVLEHPEACLQQFASAALNTDWGLRDVSNEEKIYDGMSYHQGSVWPLFTGWAALAEYRGGQPLAGYQMLKENANLTTAQDLGAVTELLSGDFFVPFGRSTSHQLWSSAMVITPTLRGLFGISVDAGKKTITVNPQLPAGWERAEVRHLAVAGDATLSFRKQGDHWDVNLSGTPGSGWQVRSDSVGSRSGSSETNRPGVQISIPPVQLSETIEHATPGSRTSHSRVVGEKWSGNQVTYTFEGKAGSRAEYGVLRTKLLPHLKFDSPENRGIKPDDEQHLAAYVAMVDTAPRDAKVPIGLVLHFPEGEGWETVTVTLTW